MADPQIKADPDAAGASPMPFADDDIYEDAGDLRVCHSLLYGSAPASYRDP